MPFELSKKIAKNSNLQHPEQTYLASPAGDANFEGRIICWDFEAKVLALSKSNGEVIGNAQLRSLAFQTVFDSRLIDNKLSRGKYLKAKLKEMLPNHMVTACVWSSKEKKSPKVFGPNKGHALYMEPELRSHVFIILT